jgi:hypothetical protein
MSPRQVGQEYYEQESRSCLGKSWNCYFSHFILSKC